MQYGPGVAAVGALMGDPARASILCALLDGRARTPTELSYVAGVSAQTTSAHLAKLSDGRLVSMEKHGRHRYYRLASPAVARAVEALMVVSAGRRERRPGPRDDALREARLCYDHIAGRLGVALTDALLARGALARDGEALALTPRGEAWLTAFGVDVPSARRRRRRFLLACLDWSERRHHVAGAVGAALAARLLELGWLRRAARGRALTVTAGGRQGLAREFGIEPPRARSGA